MNQATILFDGVCNLCTRFVHFVIARDTRNVFTFGPLQSDTARELLSPFTLDDRSFATVILLQDGKLYSHSTAALRILRELPGWGWTYALIIIPSFLRNGVYSVIAQYRYKIFGRRDSCMVPATELPDRFVDRNAEL